MPPKALEQIRRLFRADEEVEIARSENHLGFRSATTQIFTRLIEGPYPNYEQVIPRENDKSATADKAAFAAALRRMSIVASDQTHRIRMAFANGSCKLSVQTPDLGEAQEEITVSYDGDPAGDRLQRVLPARDPQVHPDRRGAAHLQGARAGRHLRAGGLERSLELSDAGDAPPPGRLTARGSRSVTVPPVLRRAPL